MNGHEKTPNDTPELGGVTYKIHVDLPTDKRLQLLAAAAGAGTVPGLIEQGIRWHVFGRLPELPPQFSLAEPDPKRPEETADERG